MSNDEILKAYKEGKKIQCRPLSGEYDWYGIAAMWPVTELKFDFENYEYRVQENDSVRR